MKRLKALWHLVWTDQFILHWDHGDVGKITSREFIEQSHEHSEWALKEFKKHLKKHEANQN